MVDPRMDLVDVVHVSQGEDAGQVDARQRRADRLGAGGKHQRVVPLDRCGAGGEVLHLDRPILTVDAADFVPRADFDVEEIAEPLGRGHQQPLSIGDRPADVVRQAAVGERDVAAPLENEDFRPFIHAAEPCGARRPSGHAAGNQHTFGRHDGVVLNAKSGCLPVT